jgi:GT2 family glycosyltransferase
MSKKVCVFSFIIPVEGVYFGLTKACYKAILNNTPKDFGYEIIFIANNVTGSHADYLINIENENSQKVKVVYKKESVGFIQSINEASNISAGENLIFMYSDIMLADPDWINKILKNLDGRTSAVGVSGIIVDRNNSREFKISKYVTDGEYDYLDTSFYVIKKEVFNKMGGFDL